MIIFGIFFTGFIIYLLWVVHRLANEPFKEEQNKQKYKYLNEEIRCKMRQVEEVMVDYSKKGDIKKQTELSRKYNEFFDKHLKKIMSNSFMTKEYYKDGKTNYPIKDMRITLSKFHTEFPEVFKRENRDRKIDQILSR